MSDAESTGPLANRLIIWTGSEDAGESLLSALTTHGGRVERWPLIETGSPKPGESDLTALERLDRYDWILFTSAPAARAMAHLDRPSAKVAAVGPRTAQCLTDIGWSVDLVPEQNDARGMARELVARTDPDELLLFARGDRALPTMGNLLTAAERQYEEVVVYTTRAVSDDRARQTVEQISTRADVVIMGSPFAVQTLAKAASPRSLGELRPGMKWVCLGSTTQRALSESGVPDAAFPERIEPGQFAQTVIAALAALNGDELTSS